MDVTDTLQLASVVLVLLGLWYARRWFRDQASINQSHDLILLTQRDRIEVLEAKVQRIETVLRLTVKEQSE